MKSNEIAIKIEETKEKIKKLDAEIESTLNEYDKSFGAEKKTLYKRLDRLSETRYMLNELLGNLRRKKLSPVTADLEDMNMKAVNAGGCYTYGELNINPNMLLSGVTI